MALQAKPLANAGVEVSGFDIRDPLTDTMKDELRALWNEHAILVFRGQDINPSRQIEFSRVFGELQIHPFPRQRHPDYPELYFIKAGTDQDKGTLAYFDGEPLVGKFDWHVDLIFTGQPSRGALLRVTEIAKEGGLTGFGDRAKVYDALDKRTQEQLEKLEVVYHFVQNQSQMRFCDENHYVPGPNMPKTPEEAGTPSYPDTAYQAVLAHPESGRKVLQIVPFFLHHVHNPDAAGLTEDEADDLLRRVVRHIRKPELHYFHEWEPGDMILWDNWRAMHSTTGTKPGIKREINRTTIAGNKMLGRQLESA